MRAFAAFRRGDYVATIDLIVPTLPDHERMSGSRAQVDLMEATLLRAYLNAGRVAIPPIECPEGIVAGKETFACPSHRMSLSIFRKGLHRPRQTTLVG